MLFSALSSIIGITNPGRSQGGILNNSIDEDPKNGIVLNPPFQLAHLYEISNKVDEIAATHGAVSSSSVSSEIEGTRYNLLMLGGLRSIEYCAYLRQIQGIYGFNDNGDKRIDKSDKPGWPEGKTFFDLLNSVEVKKLRIPEYVLDKFKSYHETEVKKLKSIIDDPKAPADKKAEAKAKLEKFEKNPFTVWADLYTHFAYQVLKPCLDEFLGTGDKPAYDLFARLNHLNQELPKELKLDIDKVDYKNYSSKATLKEIEILNNSRSKLTDYQKEVLDEIILINLFINIKYLMAVRKAQRLAGNAIGIDYPESKFMDSGANWPAKGAKPVEWKSIVDYLKSNGQIDSDIADNLLSTIKSFEGKGFDQVGMFTNTYYYYGKTFADLKNMLLLDSSGPVAVKIDPFVKISEINRTDLCSLLDLSSPDKFDELDFISDVNSKVKPDFLQACVVEKSGENWDYQKEVWSDYISRVYLALGVDLSSAKGFDGRTGLEILNGKDGKLGLLDRGNTENPDELGITARDIKELTQFIEEKKSHRPLSDSFYYSAARSIHEDKNSVPEDIFQPTGRRVGLIREKIRYSDELIGLGVLRKLYAAGIEIDGLNFRRSERSPR